MSMVANEKKFVVTKMDPEVKAKWVQRLRELDGKDMQAHSVLKNEDGKMCCLGVLTEIAVEEGIIASGVIPEKDDSSGLTGNCVNYTDEAEALGDVVTEGVNIWHGVTPPTVARWAGFARQNPYVANPDTRDHNEYYPATKVSTLAGLNDSGASFGEIADYIQADL